MGELGRHWVQVHKFDEVWVAKTETVVPSWPFITEISRGSSAKFRELVIAHEESSDLLGVTYSASKPGEALVIDSPCTNSDSTLLSGQHFENCMQISANVIDRDSALRRSLLRPFYSSS